MKRLYEFATPYIQLGGWIVVAVPALFTAYSLVSDASAFGVRITALERFKAQQEYDNKAISQKLDLVIQYTRPRR